MKTTIYLIRHAQYESPNHILPFRLPGFHLSAHGRAKATELHDYFISKHIDTVYTSPMERARETAQIIAGTSSVIVDERLNEVRSPAQGKKEGFPESMGGWAMYDSAWYKTEGGESPAQVKRRMNAFMEEKKQEHVGKAIIVVSHGDPIMMYLSRQEPYIQMGEVVPLDFSL